MKSAGSHWSGWGDRRQEPRERVNKYEQVALRFIHAGG